MLYPTIVREYRGKFFLAGSVPVECLDTNRVSIIYDSEQDAISAAISAGAERLQGVDCRKIEVNQ